MTNVIPDARYQHRKGGIYRALAVFTVHSEDVYHDMAKTTVIFTRLGTFSLHPDKFRLAADDDSSVVVFKVTVQTENPFSSGTKVVFYQSVEDESYWVRPVDEFLDGRFTLCNEQKPIQPPEQTVFEQFDEVQKKSGYQWPGVVVSVFKTLKGATRYVVECTVPEVEGALHIFSGEQLKPAAPVAALEDPAVRLEGFKAFIKAYEESLELQPREHTQALWYAFEAGVDASAKAVTLDRLSQMTPPRKLETKE